MQRRDQQGDGSGIDGPDPHDAGGETHRPSHEGVPGNAPYRQKVYLSDRRAWPRTRSDIGAVTLWTSTTESQVVEVHDESLTGLAILAADVSRITVNRDVRLAFTDCQRWATVRHIQPAEHGRYRVGLEWGCTDRRFLSGNG